MEVNSHIFGDPCPGTHKYVEVHFACAPRILATTTKRPLPPWFLQSGADNLWNNPKLAANPTESTSTTLMTTSKLAASHAEQKNIFSISASEASFLPPPTSSDLHRRPILVTGELTSVTPVRIPITTPRPTSTTTTTSTITSTIQSTTSFDLLEEEAFTDISEEYLEDIPQKKGMNHKKAICKQTKGLLKSNCPQTTILDRENFPPIFGKGSAVILGNNYLYKVA
jgi:hypothetical protein